MMLKLILNFIYYVNLYFCESTSSHKYTYIHKKKSHSCHFFLTYDTDVFENKCWVYNAASLIRTADLCKSRLKF